MIKEETQVEGLAGKPMLVDLTTKKKQKAPLILFVHGFKGFKDWGSFNAMAEAFAEAGFCFVKFNLSHNGTTPEHPTDFADLEAFGHNNYSKELNDVLTMVSFLENCEEWKSYYDFSSLTLMGHSRGGGIALLATAQDKRIQKVVTLAALLDLGRTVNPLDIEMWKEKGVRYIPNARTNQQMPLYWQFREDYLQHLPTLSIEIQAENITQPCFFLHGENDEAVDVEQAHRLKGLIPHAQLEIVPNTGHTFDAKHPWEKDELPESVSKALTFIVKFLNS